MKFLLIIPWEGIMKLFKTILILSAVSLFLVSCEEDDSIGPTIAETTFEAEDQVLSQNSVFVSSALFEESGWLVVHQDNGSNAPVVPDIVSEPVFVEAGTSADIIIPLTEEVELTGDTQLWVMAHTDTGIEGEYEFDGQNGTDGPVTDAEGDIVMSQITVSPATITVEDQLVDDNTVVIDQVVSRVDGWIVIHNQNNEGDIELPGIIGRAPISSGVNNNVEITIDDDIVLEDNQLLYPMLHIDTGELDTYEFPGPDVPEVYGFNSEGSPQIIVTNFRNQ